MAGRLVPLVLLPRYTTLAGQPGGPGYYTTVPIEVDAYSRAILTVWRGKMRAATDFSFTCWESTDQVAWEECAGDNAEDFDPGAEAEGVVKATLTRRWLRLGVIVAGLADAQATCWAVGHLEERER